jgi:ribose transport system ATP-binding protein
VICRSRRLPSRADTVSFDRPWRVCQKNSESLSVVTSAIRALVHTAATPALLVVRGVSKRYTTQVLFEVDLELRRGEVHALVGENGAGKSTLSRIIAGLTPPSAGTMELSGRRFAPRTKAEAEHRGVRMVMQELNLVGNLTAAENLFLNRLPHRWGWIDYPQLHQVSRELLDRVGLHDLDPARPVNTLGIGRQQLIEIAAALDQSCDLLILDEPTAALTDPEVQLLFDQIARLKAQGVGILYISHRMEEIRQIADRITILRDGRRVDTRPVHELSLDEIIRMMVGRELDQVLQRNPGTPGPMAMRVQHLQRGNTVRDVSFEVRCGEIFGFAGLMGSGRTETMRAIFGADLPDGGCVSLGNDPRPVRIRSPRDAVRRGIALLTEDRKEQGLFLPLAVRVNVSLLQLVQLSCARVWIRRGAEREAARHWLTRLAVRCGSPEQRAVELSGGNQQKVIIARWLFRNCAVLIFDEPTRGIDIGARLEIYRLLDALAAEGKAILVVSSDLKELMLVCDRIAVMSAGRLAATFLREQFNEGAIMQAALSGYLDRRMSGDKP